MTIKMTHICVFFVPIPKTNYFFVPIPKMLKKEKEKLFRMCLFLEKKNFFFSKHINHPI